jgi:hypothetical protein
MRKLMIIATTVLAGCGPAPDSTEVPDDAAAPAVESAATEAVQKPRILTTAELSGAVGADCRKPVGSKRKGGTSDSEIYVLTCSNANLLVTVNMDGSNKYIDCKVAGALGTPCDKDWD